MNKPLPLEEIEQLEKTEKAATPGPWKVKDGSEFFKEDIAWCVYPNGEDTTASTFADAIMIALIRNTLPRLLGMAREWHKLKAELEAARGDYEALIQNRARVYEDFDAVTSALQSIQAKFEAAKATITKCVKSGVLCAPGCCGDDCACDEMRRIASDTESEAITDAVQTTTPGGRG